ncbi:MAG: hypothetical protein ABRQ38_10755 [Candidatus Eremiobacterota bacterium]
MGELKRIRDNIYEGTLDMDYGLIGKKWKDFGTDIITGFPTFRTHGTIPRLIRDSIFGALENFPDKKTAIIVADGTYNHNNPDRTTLDAAVKSALEVSKELSPEERKKNLVIVTPYDGYQGDRTPGKGSALKVIFEEMAFCDASFLILQDGDLRNDMKQWQKVYKKLDDFHRKNHRGKEFFVTANYARHFVDASLTRFIVGPLTTLLGTYVPGGICGDIALSRGAAEHERKALWTERRRKYGTDICTTFDNIADKNTVIYEVYLGAKLHDITDEAKLNVMPGEVIGAALERIFYYEKNYGTVTAIIENDRELELPVIWGSEETGIDFIDPGFTDIFNVDTKIDTLIRRFPEFKDYIKKIIDCEYYKELEYHIEKLKIFTEEPKNELSFLNINREKWKDILYRSVAYLFLTEDIETTTKALNYLYTGAFLEFCREKFNELGYVTLQDIRTAQSNSGVEPDRARDFYRNRVDMVVSDMAKDFFKGRKMIKHYENCVFPGRTGKWT